MIQSVRFTSAAFEIRLGSRQISMFLGICFGKKKKKNAEAMKFLGTLKKYVSKNKLYTCLKKKSNVSLN